MRDPDHTAVPSGPASGAGDALYEEIAGQLVDSALEHPPVPPAPAAAESAKGGYEDVYEETAEKLVDGMLNPEATAAPPTPPE